MSKNSDHRGEHEVAVKTIVQGRPVCSGEPVVTMLVCFLRLHARLRGCGHPAFPAPFFGGVRKFLQTSDGSRCENADLCLAMTVFTQVVVPAKAGTHNHRKLGLCTMPLNSVPKRKAAAYGSLLSQGRQATIIHGITGLTFTDRHRYINPARHVRAFGVRIGIAEMTGSTRSSGGLDDRRKRLLFRCWHRGTREMDLILGRFADAEIAGPDRCRIDAVGASDRGA